MVHGTVKFAALIILICLIVHSSPFDNSTVITTDPCLMYCSFVWYVCICMVCSYVIMHIAMCLQPGHLLLQIPTKEHISYNTSH